MKQILKYEIYGILFIISAAISIAGTESIPGIGSVGRALSYISLFLAGHYYFIFPLIGLYIGLYLILRRKWPKHWSYRTTGVALLCMGLLLTSHIFWFEGQQSITAITGEKLSFSNIIQQPWNNVTLQLGQEISDNAFKQELGGGQIGAFLFAITYLLFDLLGTKLVVFSLFIISFICITNLTFQDILRISKTKITPFMKRFMAKISELRGSIRNKPSLQTDSYLDEDEHLLEIEEESYKPSNKQSTKSKKLPSFFQLFKKESSATSSTHAEHEFDEDHELDGDVLVGNHSVDSENEQVVYRREGKSDLQREQSQQQEVDLNEDNGKTGSPLFFDFQQNIEDNDTGNSHSSNQETMNVSPEQAEQENEVTIHTEQLDPSLTETDEVLPESATTNKVVKPYKMPSIDLLNQLQNTARGNSLNYKANARKLEATFESFGVRAKVLEVVRGPSVTRYEIQPDIGVKVSKIVSLTDDIALALAAKGIRMEAPIPGKSAIGIEVPNSEVSIVTMREVMETNEFQKSDAKLSIAFGRDISGQPIIANLAKMPHLLVAGATGSGKSVCINGIITSILYKAKPEEVRLLMVDPKMVELNMYNGIPHLLAPVVTDPKKASLALRKVVKEMEKRYEQFSKSGTRNIEGYNAHVKKVGEETGEKPLPYIVVIVDELADLMMVAANDVEDAICRLAQMARAAGIHLIIATQRPSVDVITGVIKANIPSRIAFGVSSQVDSRTILDSIGAEKLLGRGDMLFLPVGASKPIRVQGAFLSDEEVEKVVHFVLEQGKADYEETSEFHITEVKQEEKEEFEDELFDQAVRIVLEAKQASVSLLQRRMRVGYTRAARLIDSMENRGIVGPYEGSKPREVLLTLLQYEENTKEES
ncbi:DNA translocase FtsK [Longirhabdus pacifica]|uniref:DNA translocase FtsK n=1 Tax=Longirhabdus pacifica TaxID=2305227 RepID=UPI00100877C1